MNYRIDFIYRCKLWLQNCRRLDLLDKTPSYLRKNCALCSNHFEQQFLPKFSNIRTRLAGDAVPTIFNIPNPPPTIGSKRKAPPSKQLGKFALKSYSIILYHCLDSFIYKSIRRTSQETRHTSCF